MPPQRNSLQNKKEQWRGWFYAHRYEWLLYLLFAACHIAVSLQFSAPVTYPDEFGVLAVGNWLFGGAPWGVKTRLYYGYTFSPVAGLFLRLFGDLRVIYVGSLCAKGLLMALMPVFCYKTLGEVLQVKDTKFKLLLAGSVSLFPDVVLLSKRVTNDSGLHLLLILCLYCLGKSVVSQGRQKNKYSALLALFAVLAYGTHGLGLAYVLAALAAVVLASIITRKAPVRYPVFLGTLVLGLVADSRIKALLQKKVYLPQKGALRNTLLYSLADLMRNSLNAKGLRAFFLTFGARIQFLASVTFGLFLLFAIVLAIFLVRYARAQSALSAAKEPAAETESTGPVAQAGAVLSLFSLLSLFGCMGIANLTVLPMLDQYKGTYYFYGRYFDYAVLPLLLLGFYYLLQRGLSQKTLLLAAGASLLVYLPLCAAVQKVIVPNIMGGKTMPSTVFSALPFIGGSYAAFIRAGTGSLPGFQLLPLVIVALAVFGVLLALLLQKRRTLPLLLLSGLFLYTSAFGFVAQALPLTTDDMRYYYKTLCSLRDELKPFDDVVARFPELQMVSNRLVSSDIADTKRYRAQIAFHRYTLAQTCSFQEWRDLAENRAAENVLVLSEWDYELEAVDPAYEKIYQSSQAVFWIKGAKIKEYVHSRAAKGGR